MRFGVTAGFVCKQQKALIAIAHGMLGLWAANGIVVV